MGARPKIEELRRSAIEDYIEQLIALLDTLDGDPDSEETGDDEPSIGGAGGITVAGKPIVDLKYDTADEEENLGWSEYQSSHGAPSTGTEFPLSGGNLHFNGEGCHKARTLLRGKMKDPGRVSRALGRTRVSPGQGGIGR